MFHNINGAARIYDDVERHKTNVTFNSKLYFKLIPHKALKWMGFRWLFYTGLYSPYKRELGSMGNMKIMLMPKGGM